MYTDSQWQLQKLECASTLCILALVWGHSYEKIFNTNLKISKSMVNYCRLEPTVVVYTDSQWQLQKLECASTLCILALVWGHSYEKIFNTNLKISKSMVNYCRLGLLSACAYKKVENAASSSC